MFDLSYLYSSLRFKVKKKFIQTNLLEIDGRLPKTYSPSGTENRWQELWSKHNAFKADPRKEGESFSIVIPPPNVTGRLHMGHAFNTALIDSIVRYQRLKGKNVLCLPGTDHASIAVQTILEKKLKAEKISKEDLGRENFLKRAWDWKNTSGNEIVQQLKKLGYSVDWDREKFTLDESLSKAVNEAFIQLHKKKLIYRGEYLVNWCPATCSAVSDLEVEMKEVDGYLWHFKYPLVNKLNREKNYVVVATTRPETIFGDVAVAVNPIDDRYKDLIGEFLELPLTNRKIPIIADEHVDKDFGTGCVKVTPAHDSNDFLMGQRHSLPLITVMNKDGTMNDRAEMCRDLDRFDARKRIIELLQNDDLISKIEPYKHSVPFSDRGKVPIEPLISTQWFVSMNKLADKSKKLFDQGKPRFIPDRWGKVYFDWLDGIKDWCISRQLWWGHRIPAWFVISETGFELCDNTPYIVAASEEDALKIAQQKYGDSVRIQQEDDVLDTWFSSGLWPFSTLGWPDLENPDYQCWYPTSTLVTGFDIIFFWVARMVMMAGFLTDNFPFSNVYIHGLVRDENNKKMSKSANNGIDPIILIESYGTDALRFALIREVAGAGQDIRLDYDRKNNTSITVESSRNFANKIWNATRFVLLNIDSSFQANFATLNQNNLKISDRWILSRLNRVNIELSKKFDRYALGDVAKGLYEFVWNDFCDWYLELIKKRLAISDESSFEEKEDRKVVQQVVHHVLSQIMIMMNPLMPHITEELWHSITNKHESEFLSLQSWPVVNKHFLNDDIEKSFSQLFSTIKLIRNLRAEAGLKPSYSIPIRVISPKSELRDALKLLTPEVKRLTCSDSVNIFSPEDNKNEPIKKSITGVEGDLEVSIQIDGLVDIQALKARLIKDLDKAANEIQILEGRLKNPNFINKAPEKVVADCKEKLTQSKIQFNLANSRLIKLR